MSLLLVGLSHKTAPVEIRERAALSEKEIPSFLEKLLVHQEILQEGLVLSTCNRMEVYGIARNEKDGLNSLQNFIVSLYPGTESSLYSKKGLESVHHLFSVAAGLDSMVIGEAEILGQVKRSYQIAQASKKTGKFLNVTFQKALSTGKEVRTQTSLSRGAISVASVAVSLAERIFENLSKSRVLLIGAGKIAEKTAHQLISQKIKKLVLANRTYSRAQELARKLKGQAISLNDIPLELTLSDVVICSTGSPQPLITREMVASALPARRGQSLFLIDIAVPRDVENNVHELDNVYLYNIDDLQGIVAENLARRSSEIDQARAIVDRKAKNLSNWLDSQLLFPPNLTHLSTGIAE